MDMERHPSSFRDPSGYVFTEEDTLYRAVMPSYFSEYDHLENSGLLQKLVERNFLIPHSVEKRTPDRILLRPKEVPFITYPSEWSFNALKEAALLHLEINIMALKHQMILKDASGYNVQFMGPNAIFIDTLSFEMYREGTPWYAFGQFCRHFVAPLLLMKYREPDFNKVLHNFVDGIPLDVASQLLPWKTHLSPFIKSNIHLHAKSIAKNQGRNQKRQEAVLSYRSLMNILRYTKNFLSGLEPAKASSEWGDYYSFTNYSSESFEEKENIILSWVEEIDAKKIWDVGGNNGHFARRISFNKKIVIVSDIDPFAINESFTESKSSREEAIHSLLIDLMNPTPGFGFGNRERSSFLDRMEAINLDCTMALALIHHLCISNNCSFEMVARLFSSFSRHLIIEFVEREDSWVQKLLDNMGNRRELFDYYNRENFEAAFKKFYYFDKKRVLGKGKRLLYFLRVKDGVPRPR